MKHTKASWIKKPSLPSSVKVALFFCASMAFFLYQHHAGSFWDFTAYLLNARHMLGMGGYFEWMRPPLVSLAMAPFATLGIIGEHLFIAATLAFFMYAAYRLSIALKADYFVMLIFLFQPMFIIFGGAEGSELIGAALLFLFFEGVIRKRPLFSLFLGLAVVTRYSALYFLPLLLFYRKPKKIVLAASLALAPLGLWFLANLILTGNIFTSFADNYALNKVFRDAQGVDWLPLLGFIGAPFLIAAAYFFSKRRKHWGLMAFISGITIYTYLSTPMKVSRYLFLLILPIAYSLTMLYAALGKRQRLALVGASLAFTAVFLYTAPWIDTGRSNVDEAMSGLPIKEEDGPFMSNAWVHLNYYGHDALPYPGDAALDYFILGGYKVVVFKHLFPVGTEVEEYPVMYEDDRVLVLGIPDIRPISLPLDTTYLRFRELEVGIRTDSPYDMSPCAILFSGIAHRGCEAFHDAIGFRETVFQVPENGWSDPATEKEGIIQDYQLLQSNEKAAAAERLASLSQGEERAGHLRQASETWDEVGEKWRADIIRSISPAWEPIPSWSAKGLGQGRERYCDIVPCRNPPLAVWNSGHWYLPDAGGTYKYRAETTDILKEGNYQVSRTISQVNDLSITVIS